MKAEVEKARLWMIERKVERTHLVEKRDIGLGGLSESKRLLLPQRQEKP